MNINFQQIILDTLNEMNTAAVGIGTTGAFGSTTDPIPNPTTGAGYSPDVKFDMSVAGGVNPSRKISRNKRRKHKNKVKNNVAFPKEPINKSVLYTTRRSLKQTT